MNARFLCGMVLGSFLLLTKVAVSADESKEVPLPKMPKGAGKVDKDAPKKFTATASGLKFRVLRKGTGGKPKEGNTVKVNYRGWFDNGKEFESSYKREKPISVPLGSVSTISQLGKVSVIKGGPRGCNWLVKGE